MLCSLNVSAGKFEYYYIEAVRQQDMENYLAAFELFRHCYELNPNAPEANYAIGMFYIAMQQDSLGVAYLKRAIQLEPDNNEFGERLARTYLYQNNATAAAEVYETLVKHQPDRTDYLEQLLQIYSQQHDYPKMLSILDRIELQEGQTESITLEKMRIRSMMDDNDGAYRELQSLIDAHPFDMNLRVMLGNWYLNQGKKEEALTTFNDVLSEEPDNAQAQMALMDYYRSEGEIAQADTLLYDILVNPRTNSDNRLELISSWVRDSESRGGDSIRIIQVFDRVLAMPQATSDVATMKAAYLELKKFPSADIQQAWRDVLRIAPENTYARLQLIQHMWSDSIDDNVIRECEKALEYIPDEPSLYYYLGLAQFINKRNKDAIRSLRRGASNITAETNKDMAADIYSLLGDIYQKEGRIQDTYTAYDSCLVYNPEKVMCLNNYAYFLSEEGKDLKKAEKMSYRAITADPQSAIYLDTYAWILYKQKRYEDAKAYIDMAIEKLKEGEDTDGEIAGHAAKINKKLKKKK